LADVPACAQLICGYLGDKLGRRNQMLGTVSVMGLASVLMGLLPTYAQIGVWAPALLVALRIIQGFALGGESTGAQLMALAPPAAAVRTRR
jgi:MFS family permease